MKRSVLFASSSYQHCVLSVEKMETIKIPVHVNQSGGNVNMSIINIVLQNGLKKERHVPSVKRNGKRISSISLIKEYSMFF